MRWLGLVVVVGIGVAAAGSGCNGSSGGPADLAVPDLTKMLLPPLCDNSMQGDAGIPAVFSNIEKIFEPSCALDACHVANFKVQGGIAVDLSHGHAWDNLVNQKAKDLPNQCGGILVTPGDPQKSFLMVKLTTPLGQQCNPQGSQMPIGEPFFMPLDDCQIDLVRRWILAGAPR